MKKIIVGIAIIILASAIGLFIYFNIDKDLSPDKENQKTEEVKQEKDPNTIENKHNKELQKEKCHEILCINDLNISKQAGVYAISASIKNTSKTAIEDKAFNLVFTDESGTKITRTYYLLKVEAEKEVPLEIHFTEAENTLMNVNSYKIETASQDEYNLVKSKLDN